MKALYEKLMGHQMSVSASVRVIQYRNDHIIGSMEGLMYRNIRPSPQAVTPPTCDPRLSCCSSFGFAGEVGSTMLLGVEE
jgi:hypothetical protein